MPTYSQLSRMIANRVDEAILENAALLEDTIRSGIESAKNREEINVKMIINAMSVTARISIQSTLMILHEAGIITFEGGLTPDLTLLSGGLPPHGEHAQDKTKTD